MAVLNGVNVVNRTVDPRLYKSEETYIKRQYNVAPIIKLVRKYCSNPNWIATYSILCKIRNDIICT